MLLRDSCRQRLGFTLGGATGEIVEELIPLHVPGKETHRVQLRDIVVDDARGLQAGDETSGGFLEILLVVEIEHLVHACIACRSDVGSRVGLNLSDGPGSAQQQHNTPQEQEADARQRTSLQDAPRRMNVGDGSRYTAWSGHVLTPSKRKPAQFRMNKWGRGDGHLLLRPLVHFCIRSPRCDGHDPSSSWVDCRFRWSLYPESIRSTSGNRPWS